MGLADRDYMRERARARAGQSTPRRSPVRSAPQAMSRGRQLIFLLAACPALFHLYQDLARRGWIPDFHQTVPFPPSGEGLVSPHFNPKSMTARLTIIAADSNAVLKLQTPWGKDVASVFVRASESVRVKVPPGTYRIHLIEGDKWYGPDRLFGRSMTVEQVLQDQTLTPTKGIWIDLHRKLNGNLPTRPVWTTPGL